MRLHRTAVVSRGQHVRGNFRIETQIGILIIQVQVQVQLQVGINVLISPKVTPETLKPQGTTTKTEAVNPNPKLKLTQNYRNLA